MPRLSLRLFSLMTAGLLTGEFLKESTVAASSPPAPRSQPEFGQVQRHAGSYEIPASVTTEMHRGWHAAQTGAIQAGRTPSVRTRGDAGAELVPQPVPEIVRLGHREVGAPARPQCNFTWREQLLGWESATRTLTEISDRDRAWLQRLNDTEVSALALNAACEFLGSVSAADLQRRYTWELASGATGGAVLLATPADEMERLFLPQLRVSLHPTTQQVAEIGVLGRDRQWQAIRIPLPPTTERIVLTSHSADALPPSPAPPATSGAPLIRFAAETMEIEVR